MTLEFQIVVDAADPHAQADWWAETLGWEVEPSDEDFIRRMVAEGHATDEDTKVHNGVVVWKEGQAILHPDRPADGTARRRILFQVVPEGKTVKNRLHFDLRVGAAGGDIEAEAGRLVGRGANILHRGQQGPVSRWLTLADPEGNEFCVS